MHFDLSKSIEILKRTPIVIEPLLEGLHDDWVKNNEGPETWSPFDIVGHLIHGEKTDWLIRTDIILSNSADKTFEPFDRFAQFEASKGKTLKELLTTFKHLREKNISDLLQHHISTTDLHKKGIHPAFGEVSLAQLLASWVVHDLGHIGQITRVMAKQYTDAVGPWKEYLPVLE
ncbi:MAG TPA: DinB family protein [Bacteroidia bacterium]|jgi:hypothetical protein|nr:DinB family protein [Bacteroidia bacterium]